MSHMVTSGTLGDMVLNGLHDSPGFCLHLLPFACKLDLVECDKSMTNAPRSTKIVERIFELCKPELLLAVGDAP